MGIFENFAKKAVKKKATEKVEENWEAILDILGLVIGAGIFFFGRSEKRESPQSITIVTNNYYFDKEDRK